MGGGPRDVAEHFVDLHSSRFLVEEASRGRLHSSSRSKDYLDPSNLKLEDVVTYLERVRDRAERGHPPTRRTQETQTVPAALLPMAASTFLLQELSSTPPQHLHQVRICENDRYRADIYCVRHTTSHPVWSGCCQFQGK